MVFEKVFRIFEKNKPHYKFLDLYSKLNKLAATIQKDANLLRDMQKTIVKTRTKTAKGKTTGAIGLSKTEYIEEALIPKLKKLAIKTEDRFLEASEETKEQEPSSMVEEAEINKVIVLLEKVKKFAKSSDLSRLNDKEKLERIGARLREIDNLLKEFHYAEVYTRDLARKVEKREIKPIINKIFEKAKPSNNFSVKVTDKQLKDIVEESEKINQYQDKNWRIIWRKWHQTFPKFEIDMKTDIKKPHINATFVLNGKKKDIHLIKAA
jgi:hypothetical protein